MAENCWNRHVGVQFMFSAQLMAAASCFYVPPLTLQAPPTALLAATDIPTPATKCIYRHTPDFKASTKNVTIARLRPCLFVKAAFSLPITSHLPLSVRSVLFGHPQRTETKDVRTTKRNWNSFKTVLKQFRSCFCISMRPRRETFSCSSQSLSVSAVIWAPNQRLGRGDDVCVTSS